MKEQKVGVVSHYYGHLGVGIVKIEQGQIKLGDKLHFKGHTTDFEQTIESMQAEHNEVQEAKAGEVVGLKVAEHVREHDQVLKISA